MPSRRLALLLAAVGVAVCAVVVVVIVGTDTQDEGDVAVEPDVSQLDAPPTPVPPAPPAISHGLAGADVALDHLRQALTDPEYTNLEILTTLASVRLAYMYPFPPPGTPLYAPRPGTPDDDRRPVLEPDLAAHAEKHGWPDEYLDAVREHRRAVERLYLKALTLELIDPGTGTNTRDAVNIRAAQLLGETGNPDLSDDIIKTLEQVIFRAKYEVPQQVYDEALATLARLGELHTFMWMTGLTAFRSPWGPEVAQAALKAMLLFDRSAIPGATRHRAVTNALVLAALARTLVRAAGNPEDIPYRALLSTLVWVDTHPLAIQVAKHFAFNPRGADGKPLEGKQFMDWYSDHKDSSKPPWTDD